MTPKAMSKQIINLEEIWEDAIKKYVSQYLNTDANTQKSVEELAVSAMRQAVEQAIDLCAENADTTWEGSQIDGKVVIKKQSILNTKNQIK
jgi:hypothetical protein